MSPPDPSTEAELARLQELYQAYEQARTAERAAYEALAQQARRVNQRGLSLEAIAARLGVYKARVQYWGPAGQAAPTPDARPSATAHTRLTGRPNRLTLPPPVACAMVARARQGR